MLLIPPGAPSISQSALFISEAGSIKLQSRSVQVESYTCQLVLSEAAKKTKETKCEQVNKIKQARRSVEYSRGEESRVENKRKHNQTWCHRGAGESNRSDFKLQHTEEERSNSKMFSYLLNNQTASPHTALPSFPNSSETNVFLKTPVLLGETFQTEEYSYL